MINKKDKKRQTNSLHKKYTIWFLYEHHMYTMKVSYVHINCIEHKLAKYMLPAHDKRA